MKRGKAPEKSANGFTEGSRRKRIEKADAVLHKSEIGQRIFSL